MRQFRGTVYKVAGYNNGYRGQISIAGRTFFKYFAGCKAICQDRCKIWQREMYERYAISDNDTLTWTLFREKWNEYAANANPPFAKRTIQEHNYAFDRVERHLKPRNLSDITVRKLRLMITELAETAKKAGQDNYGVNKVIMCMRKDLRWAMNCGYMDDLPVDNIALLPVAPPVPNTDGLKAIEALLRHGDTRERVIVLLGFDCGLRPDEIFNLRWEKLDLVNRFGWISDTVDWRPKRHKVRQFRITIRLLNELNKLKNQTSDLGYVLADKNGNHYTTDGYSRLYKEFVARVNKIVFPFRITGTCKTLRKDYCTYRQSKGADQKNVSAAMGHADTDVTRKHYTDTQRSELKTMQEQKERENLLKLDAFEVPLDYKN